MARRLATNARLAVRMMVHDRPKLVGSLAGVVFAVVLVIQQQDRRARHEDAPGRAL